MKDIRSFHGFSLVDAEDIIEYCNVTADDDIDVVHRRDIIDANIGQTDVVKYDDATTNTTTSSTCEMTSSMGKSRRIYL